MCKTSSWPLSSQPPRGGGGGSGGMFPQKVFDLGVWDHIWWLLRPIVTIEPKAIKY